MPQFSLKSLKSQLDLWRMHQNSNRQSAPESIWRAAAQIAKETSPSYVAKKLSLNSHELQKWINGLDDVHDPIEFIELENEELSSSPMDDFTHLTSSIPGKVPSIEYALKNGDTIKFHVPDLSAQNLLAILIGGRS